MMLREQDSSSLEFDDAVDGIGKRAYFKSTMANGCIASRLDLEK